MSGIYVHIPFCLKKCSYCDFYTVTTIKQKTEYINSLLKELKQRQNYIIKKEVETIYFGGGTPSTLNYKEIQLILNEIKSLFSLTNDAEITLEANPDDLTEEYVNNLKKTDINRLSIGFQSFFDSDLKQMNRRHNASDIYESIKFLKNAGFNNISGDLIYGLPGLTIENWEYNLNEFFKLEIPHLSAYHLTYEPKSVFGNLLKRGKLKEITEEESLEQFKLLKKLAEIHGYIHYETSNFAKKGFFSRHNTAYWQEKPYIGIGVSAHSYNLISRQFNVSNMKQYMKGVSEDCDYYTKEILSLSEQYNDYIITTLRTIWGTDLEKIKYNFGQTYYEYILKQSKKFVLDKYLIIDSNMLKTSAKGKFIEDYILEKLIYI